MNKSVKSGSSSPVKTNRSNAKNISFGSPTCKTAATSNPSPMAKVFHVALVRSPVTHNKTKQCQNQTIYHEAKIVQNLLANQANKVQPAKRDPILQNNGELADAKRPLRRPQSAERSRPNPSRDEVIKRSKLVGEYNHVFNPRPEDPKPEGIRVFNYTPSESTDETWRRISRTVRPKSETRRNPITEGEVNIFKRSKKAVEEMTDAREFNDRKYLLPAQRGVSSAGKLFRTKSCLAFDEFDDFSSVKTDRSRPSTPNRAMTPMQMKMRGFAKGVLEYEEGPNYRDQGVTGKVGTIKFADLVNSLEGERVFARKSTLGF